MSTDTRSEILPFDFASPLYQANPEGYASQVRDLEPIHWSDAAHLWVITRYEDCQEILKNHDFGRGDTYRIVTQPGEALLPVEQMRYEWMLFRDLPDHTRLRSLVHRAFTPRILRTLQPAIGDIMDRLLLEYADRNEINLIDAVCYPLPLTVIAVLLGVPVEDWELFRRYADDLRGVLEVDKTDEQIENGNRLANEMKIIFAT